MWPDGLSKAAEIPGEYGGEVVDGEARMLFAYIFPTFPTRLRPRKSAYYSCTTLAFLIIGCLRQLSSGESLELINCTSHNELNNTKLL